MGRQSLKTLGRCAFPKELNAGVRKKKRVNTKKAHGNWNYPPKEKPHGAFEGAKEGSPKAPQKSGVKKGKLKKLCGKFLVRVPSREPKAFIFWGCPIENPAQQPLERKALTFNG